MSSAPSEVAGRSLATRITAWYAFAFAVSIAVLVVAALPAIRSAIKSEDKVVVETKAERHLALLLQHGLPAYQTAVEQSSRLGETDSVRVRDAQGRTLFQHGDVSAALRTASRSSSEVRVELGSAANPWAAVRARLRPGLVVLALATILIAILGGFYVTRRALRPIRDLAATARAVSESGDLSKRVPEQGGSDELDELTRLFNSMLDRNQRLVRGMREALDNVAHDLRTPLTRLRGSAEVALASNDPEAAKEALADTIEESDHVLQMLRALMDISQAETGLLKLERARVSLNKLAEDSVELYSHVADEAGVELSVRSSPQADDTVVLVDPARMRQAIANLIDNAIKHTPRGGHIDVEVAQTDTAALIRVRDTGEGIPTESLPRIWDRLYRADPSRSRPGLGLGLSLVKAIVLAHDGEVSVVSQPGRGSTFTISIPRAPAAQATVPRDAETMPTAETAPWAHSLSHRG